VTEVNNDNIEKLIAEYQPQIKSFIRKRVENKEDAEDILQDVFYQFVKTVHTSMNPIEQVAAWLYRVTKHTIINHGKKRHEKTFAYPNNESDEEILKDFSDVLFNNEVAPSPETEYLRSLVWTELENALADLPHEQRAIYELTEFDDIPIKKIAQTTGVPINTLLSRKHYAVLHLRRRMKQLYYEVLYL
jgi:RNA polymerase sigma factor (sigma-70 family)